VAEGGGLPKRLKPSARYSPLLTAISPFGERWSMLPHEIVPHEPPCWRQTSRSNSHEQHHVRQS